MAQAGLLWLFCAAAISFAAASHVDSDAIACSLCRDVVKDMEMAVTNKRVHSEMMTDLHKVCGLLSPEASTTCTMVLSGLTQDVLHHFLKDTQPQELCSAMTVCQAQRDVLIRRAIKPNDNQTCGLCKFVVQTVDALLKENKTEQAINATVYQLCNVLPDAIKATCLGLAPDVMKALENGMDPTQACTFLGLCTSTGPVRLQRQPKDNQTCGLCKFVVQTVDALLKENKTEQAINATVYKLCNALPDAIKATCLGLAPDVVKALENGMDPTQACTFLGLCTSTGPVRLQRQPKDNQTCGLCKFVVQTVDALLKENKTEQAINATVYKLCNALPDAIKATCLGLAPDVVKALENGMDPTQACTFLGLCTSTGPVRLQRQPKDNQTCGLCKFVVQTVDALLKENKTEQAINATVYKLCNALPDAIKATCLGLAPDVVKALENGMDPTQACTFLGLCTSTGPVRLQRQPKDNQTCGLCKFVVQTVDALLKENKTEQAINATVYKLCNALPDAIKATCLGLAPDVVKALENGMDPTQACTFLGLCTSTGPVRLQRQPKDNQTCGLCKFVVQTVDALLKENKTEQAINATVYKLCNALPDAIKATCLGLTPDVVKALENGMDPTQACTFLGLCTSTDVKTLPRQRKDDTECSLCELGVKVAEGYLSENSTREAINTTIHRMCNELPAFLKKECLALAPNVLKALFSEVDPEQICMFLHMCPTPAMEVSPRDAKFPEFPTANPACDLCELVVQFLDQSLAKNISALNDTVYTLCNSLPDTLKSTCFAFAPQLVAMIAKGVDPKVACTAVKLCTSAEDEAKLKRELSFPSGAVECELCEELVKLVDAFLGENATKAQINSTVYSLCHDLPLTLQDTCLKFAPQVVSILTSGIDPKMACTAVGLCTSQGMDLKIASWCTICRDHLKIIDFDLYREEGAVLHLLEDFCHRLPPPTDQACLSMVDSQFPAFWEHFLNGTASAENICKMLHICP